MADNIYIFDKYTLARSLLGEIQRDFNMSIVMDGTKDSMQVEVINFDDIEVEPNSIIWHENTNTWWIVDKDKVNGYYGENGKLYIHELSLLGAIELLNARDLTDCGFKDNFYTIRQFLNRLMSLSSFEYDTSFVSNSLDFDQKVDYIKTYENYSLLTALREFFDGYNCVAKLVFNTTSYGDYIVLDTATINIYPKSGRDELVTLNISTFQETKEMKTIDRSSYGSSVVSNAQNVVSTKMKKYPILGGTSLSANAHIVNASNAVLRLPSDVFDIEYVDMYWRAGIYCYPADDLSVPLTYEYAFNDHSAALILMRNYIIQEMSGESYYQELLDDFDSKYNDIYQRITDFATVRFYKGCGYDAMNNKIVVPANSNPNLYIPALERYDQGWNKLEVALFDEEVWETLNSKVQGFYWKRGNNLLSGFDFLDYSKLGQTRRIYDKDSTLGRNYNDSYLYSYYHNGQLVFYFTIRYNYEDLTIYNTMFQVVYIPMSDIKIKVDNYVNGNDNQIYNQTGKITDSVALSKLLNSYSNEITSDKLTRFMHYYSYTNIPVIGQKVLSGDDIYVINNISYNFFENENSGGPYFISCEFTMSKQIATKSLMVNPDSDVRDYGIPQNYNVKRKQLYRDYYTFDFVHDTRADYEYFRPLTDIINYGTSSDLDLDHVAFIWITYDENIGDSDNAVSNIYCYQLDTIKYRMKKMSIEVVDFKDNNIIGYGSQNIFSGFNLNNLINMNSKISTPISYVDNNGRFKDIRILFANIDQTQTAINNYINDNHLGFDYSYFKWQPFIDVDLFQEVLADGYDYEIYEQNYNKDALEVPFFEYIVQLGDTKKVIVGDNIFSEDEVDGINNYFLYGFVIQDLNTITNLNAFRFTNIYGTGFILNACKIEYVGNVQMKITFYNSASYSNGEVSYNTQQVVQLNKDIGIYRYQFDKSHNLVKKDLLFVIRGATSDVVDDDKLILQINHYKLK